MGKKLKILHLEDSSSDAELVHRVLKKADFHFERLLVDSEVKFVSALDEFRPDVILSDHSLPSFNSHEALAIFRERKLKIPFILITSNVSEEFAVDVIKKGADDYILKDRLGRLPSAIQNALEKYQLELEKQSYLYELIKNERHYRALIENGADVLVVLTANGKPKYVSPSITQVLGFTEHEALNLNLFDVLHPDDKEKTLARFAHCLQSPGIPLSGHEGRTKNKKGEWVWLEATMTNMLHDPSINGIVENFRDISGRKEAEEKVQRTERKYKGLIEHSADGMTILSAEGKVLYAAPSKKPVLGYNEEEVSKLDLFQIVHPEDVGSLKDVLHQVSESLGIPITVSGIRLLHKDGFYIYVEGSLTNMFQDENIGGIVVNFRNITDRVLSDKKIKASEERYRAFFENSTDGIALAITDGDIFAANPSACRMFGMTEEEICKTGRLGLVHSADHPKVFSTIAKKRLDGRATIDLLLVRKDGTTFPGEVTTVDFKDNSGAENTSLIVRDMSERKLAEEKILHANRLYSFISEINQTIVHVKDEQILFDEACRIAIEVGKFKFAWIGIVNSGTANIQLAASHGASIDQITFFKDYTYELEGPIAKVVKGLSHAIVANSSEAVETGLRGFAKQSGFNSVIVLPIKKGDELYATFKIYAAQPDFFDDQEVDLLSEATEDISFALDVMEKDKLRTLAEKSLFESQKKLMEAQHLAKIGSWETDLKTLELQWSQEAHRIFELCEEGSLHHTDFLSSIHVDDRENVDAAFKNSLNSHIPHSMEHRIVTKFGTEKYVIENWQIIQDADGIPMRAVGTVQDVTERRIAEEKLKKTEFRYKQIVETAQEGIWLIGADDTTIFVNEKLCDILGYNKGEIIGKKPFEFMDEEGQVIVAKSLEEKRKGISSQVDFKYISKSGKDVWTSVSSNPFFDSDGTYNGSLAMISDISEKKALEQLLDRATTLARIGTYEVDLTNNTLYWSPMTKEIHEVDEGFIPDMETAINFYKPGANRELISKAVNQAIDSNIPFDMEMQIITAKGNERWVRAIGEAEFRNGECTRLYGSFQDIDKLKVVETEILKIYAERNSILESIDDAFFAVDKNWIITYWNNKAETVLGLLREDVLHREIWQVFPRGVEIFYEVFNKAVTENTVQRLEFHASKKLHIWLDVSAYPASNGLSVFFKDITERKTSEARLYDLNKNLQKFTSELLISNKGMEQFSYVISHNLRAPVANLLGLAEELKDTSHNEETKQFLSSELINNARRLDNVILDLNSILQIKSELSELKETVCLTHLIQDIQSSISNLISKEHVEIIISGIETDEFFTLKSFLHSIFYNLISNSIKYRQPGLNPVIEIKSRREKDKLIISFKDNGRGLNLEKHKDQIFGLYKRFHLNIEGKGMGLFMVKTQVEVLGGTVTVSSEIDKGTEFTLTFSV
ncbi:MAG: hypothetical protein K0S09_1559 [Sphingobacteriaceae bacterium]|jgi:PAS domain S-box-containing protein|nr:hypothetical protein [Sphingobacteriaceae bacterium]